MWARGSPAILWSCGSSCSAFCGRLRAQQKPRAERLLAPFVCPGLAPWLEMGGFNKAGREVVTFCTANNNLRITLPGSHGSSAFHFSSRCVLPHAKRMSYSSPSPRRSTLNSFSTGREIDILSYSPQQHQTQLPPRDGKMGISPE